MCSPQRPAKYSPHFDVKYKEMDFVYNMLRFNVRWSERKKIPERHVLSELWIFSEYPYQFHNIVDNNVGDWATNYISCEFVV